jgi:guanylate kinase
MRSESPEPDGPTVRPGTSAAPRAPLIIVSGPSGVGKTTVVEELLKRGTLPLRRAVTATTRDKRPGEVDGVSYHFWSRDEFRKAIDDGRMLESEPVFGLDFYGTPRSEVDGPRAEGKAVILVIDVKGAARVRQMCPDALSVFIRPPNFRELEARLRGRGDLPEERIQRRLATAHEETARAGEFQHVIINDDLGQAVAELERLVRSQFTTGGKACSTS